MNKEMKFVLDFLTKQPMGTTTLGSLRVNDCVLFSRRFPLAIRCANDILLVNTAQDTFTANMDATLLYSLLGLDSVKTRYTVVPFNFRDANHLLCGYYGSLALLDWAEKDLEESISYNVDLGITVLKGCSKCIIVFNSNLALKEHAHYLGFCDTSKCEELEDTLKAIELNQTFILGNVVCIRRDEIDLACSTSDVVDKSNQFVNVFNTPSLGDFAYGRVHHAWYPKRLELDRYYEAFILPVELMSEKVNKNRSKG